MLPEEAPVEAGALKPNILDMECREETGGYQRGCPDRKKEAEQKQSVNGRPSTKSDKLTAPGETEIKSVR